MWELDCEEHRRIDTFELWCWRRLLRVLWTARTSNQSILKEISPGISLKGIMLKLKLQYFGHPCKELTHWLRLWRWKGLGVGGEGDDRGWDGWMASLTRWTESEWTPEDGDRQGGLAFAIHGVPKSRTWLSDWTELKIFLLKSQPLFSPSGNLILVVAHAIYLLLKFGFVLRRPYNLANFHSSIWSSLHNSILLYCKDRDFIY